MAVVAGGGGGGGGSFEDALPISFVDGKAAAKPERASARPDGVEITPHGYSSFPGRAPTLLSGPQEAARGTRLQTALQVLQGGYGCM